MCGHNTCPAGHAQAYARAAMPCLRPSTSTIVDVSCPSRHGPVATTKDALNPKLKLIGSSHVEVTPLSLNNLRLKKICLIHD